MRNSLEELKRSETFDPGRSTPYRGVTRQLLSTCLPTEKETRLQMEPHLKNTLLLCQPFFARARGGGKSSSVPYERGVKHKIITNTHTHLGIKLPERWSTKQLEQRPPPPHPAPPRSDAVVGLVLHGLSSSNVRVFE